MPELTQTHATPTSLSLAQCSGPVTRHSSMPAPHGPVAQAVPLCCYPLLSTEQVDGPGSAPAVGPMLTDFSEFTRPQWLRMIIRCAFAPVLRCSLRIYRLCNCLRMWGFGCLPLFCICGLVSKFGQGGMRQIGSLLWCPPHRRLRSCHLP